MATNWPPAAGTYPSWPPSELGTSWLSFSDLQAAIDFFKAENFTWRNPNNTENRNFFRSVTCDEGHNCSGVMIISSGGLAYPFAYCNAASHRSVMVLWVVGRDQQGNPVYDLGSMSGVFK